MVKLDKQETLLLQVFSKADTELRKGHYVRAFILYLKGKHSTFSP
jgi:hypothetical protein